MAARQPRSDGGNRCTARLLALAKSPRAASAPLAPEIIRGAMPHASCPTPICPMPPSPPPVFGRPVGFATVVTLPLVTVLALPLPPEVFVAASHAPATPTLHLANAHHPAPGVGDLAHMTSPIPGFRAASVP